MRSLLPARIDCPPPWCRAVGLRIAACGFLSLALQAHDVLSEFVQHDLRLEISREHIDITVDLTFFEDASEVERRRMDADGDGRIRRSELDGYAGKLEARLQDGISLKLGNKVLPLVMLRAPEPDLLGDDRAHRAHHRLRLSHFCATPKDLKPKTVVVAEEGLWPEWPSVATVTGSGTPGYQIKADSPASALTRKLGQDQTRKFRWMLIRVPTPDSSNPSLSDSNPQQSEP